MGGVEWWSLVCFLVFFEVMDLVWRLLMEWMEQLLGDGTRWKLYIYSCSNTFSLSLLPSLSLPLTPTAKEHLPEKKSTTPSSSFPS